MYSNDVIGNRLLLLLILLYRLLLLTSYQTTFSSTKTKKNIKKSKYQNCSLRKCNKLVHTKSPKPTKRKGQYEPTDNCIVHREREKRNVQ